TGRKDVCSGSPNQTHVFPNLAQGRRPCFSCQGARRERFPFLARERVFPRSREGPGSKGLRTGSAYLLSRRLCGSVPPPLTLTLRRPVSRSEASALWLNLAFRVDDASAWRSTGTLPIATRLTFPCAFLIRANSFSVPLQGPKWQETRSRALPPFTLTGLPI